MKYTYPSLAFSLLQWSLFSFFLVATAFSSTNAATNQTDLSALLSFKSLITNDPFQVLSSWNDSFHHCEWQGIRCGRRHPDRVTALILNSKQLSGQISPSLANLTFLRTLNLSDNQLTGSIPQELGRLSRMRFVNLSTNSLDGMIPHTLNNCSHLKVLSLGSNKLQGAIPTNLVQCRNLRIISMRKNLLFGSIPLEFGSLHQLVVLDLYENKLTGIIPDTLSNLTNLKNLVLSHNNLSGSIPTSLDQLQKLNILQLGFNRLSGKIPNSIYNLSALAILGLAGNQLEGTLPPDMCDSFPNLKTLLIYKNQLKGQIPTSISNCSALTEIEFDFNNLTGKIPSTIGTLKNLLFFKVNENLLEAQTPSDWSFIDALINCTSFEYLELGANQFQGIIPSTIANLSSNLYYLGLYMNPISGTIPVEIRKLTNLTKLALGQTYLTGTIPEEFGNLCNLEFLDLSGNLLSGKIPSTFGNLTRMNRIYLDTNALEGRIPVELTNMKNLEIMDFGSNKLTGSIPKEIMNLSTPVVMDFSSNYLTGSLPPEIGKLKNLGSIYLSNNKLSRQIPSTIDGCQVLEVLYLDGNLFEGIIPSSLSNMRGLQVLNLSNNSFTGQVPEFIGRMNLTYLDISFNHFEGELPKEGVFKNASEVDARGNPKLCGGVPEMHLSKCIIDSPRRKHHYLKFMAIIISICGGFLFFAIIVSILGCYLIKRSRNNPQSSVGMISQFQNVSYNDLFRATQGFSSENIVGRGTFGAVYKANMVFENVRIVAVKVLNIEQHGASRSFLAECEALRNIRHRNLIKVLSVCSSIDHQGNDFKALVFEFMPNGNLEAWLHPNACLNRPFKSLNIIQRLNIAIDVAVALDYLHDHGTVPIVHCDLKPSNVLLDNEMTAHVGDFGLARFLVRPETMPSQSITSTSGIKGSIGYIPPEYGMGCQVSVQGDVYSYGVLLLEMCTGVSPTDERFVDGLNLHRHVEMAFPDNVVEIIDTKLFSENHGAENNGYALKNIIDCLVSVTRCGLQCCNESPKDRISMKEVVKQLNSARAKLAA